MLSRFNRLTEALNETLLTRATDIAFTRLSALYGFSRPAGIAVERWRSALLHSVYAARGTAGPIFRFLEEVFGEWIDENSTFTLQVIGPNSLSAPSATCAWENRLVRYNGDLYRSTYLESGALWFVNVNTPMFKAADFPTGENIEVKLLPFDIDERGGEYKVLIDGGIFGFPRTFLKSDADDVRSGDEPFGGQLLDFTSDTLGERFGDPLGEGPYPIYLGSNDFTEALREAFRGLLAAGIKGQLLGFDWCPSGTSIYGSYADKVKYGYTAPGKPNIIEPTRG